MSESPGRSADGSFNSFVISSLLESCSMLSLHPFEGGWKKEKHGRGDRRREMIISCKDSKKIDEVNTRGGYYLVYSCKSKHYL